ncbi:hypothetical protein ACFWPQ_38290 [Streptomyces sp. NPDC058464]|uniref:hypothetical protein n=1 Tax=Streptomyces sp. NPDC058464 TaxID=3346511 RepID=UPI0036585A57
MAAENSGPANRRQSVGDVSDSEDIAVDQYAETDGEFSQAVGSIRASRGVRIRQQVGQSLDLASSLLGSAALHDVSLEEVRAALGSIGQVTITSADAELAAAQAEHLDNGSSKVSRAIQALAAALTVTTGALAIGSLSSVEAMAVAAPMTLLLTHLIEPEPVMRFLQWLGSRLRGNL